jgi:hypothetical protein
LDWHISYMFFNAQTFTFGVVDKHLSIAINACLPFAFIDAFWSHQPPSYSYILEFIYYLYILATHIPSFSVLHFTSFFKYNFRFSQLTLRSRGSSVSIVTDYGLDDRDSIPDRGRGFIF